jgi:hypothetical protein
MSEASWSRRRQSIPLLLLGAWHQQQFVPTRPTRNQMKELQSADHTLEIEDSSGYVVRHGVEKHLLGADYQLGS